MTPKQSEALLFIDMYWEDNACAPTYDDIKDHLSLKSKSGAFVLVKRLTELGYVTTIKGGRRTVRPTGMPQYLIKKKLELRQAQEAKKEQANG